MFRVIIAIVVGTVVTVNLLWVMQHLIVMGVPALGEERTVRFVDFVRVQRDERTEVREEKPQPPPSPDAPPPDQLERNLDNMELGTGGGFGVTTPPVSHEPVLGREPVFGDGEYTPIVRVAPNYPRRAEQRGLEGYVTLEFTVTRQGTVRDARVVESSNSVFDSAAVEAVMRFRYRPRVIDGEPVDVPGVQFRMTFQLER